MKARIREAICPVFLAGSLVWLHAADRRLLAAEGGTKTSAPISAQVRKADDYYLGRQNLANLAKAVLFTTSPLLMNTHDRETFARVEAAVRLSRYGGDCYAYCMLAAGHVDLVIETELKPYDVLPLMPIIVGAGGVITTWEGGAPHAGGRIIAAGDKRVHAAAMAALKG